MQKFTKRNGWYTSWSDLAKGNDIYALVIKGTVDIQGLVAVKKDVEMNMPFISWMVAAPQNNSQLVDQKKYLGVGGHLFAIAVQKSQDYGFDGELTGFAANADLEKHYIDNFDAEPIHMLHPYHIYLSAESGKKIQEVYTYEWTDDEL